jgi:hypothetical protein
MSSETSFVCEKCSELFESRNKLFKHIKKCLVSSSAAVVTDPEPTRAISPLEASPGTFLYVTGGRFRGRTLTSVERYKPSENVWEKCPSLQEGRGSHGAAGINGKLYAIGGGGFHSNLASCEVFDGVSWTNMAPAPSVRHALAVVETPTKLYAIGGWMDGSKCSNAMESYDPVTDSWVTLPSMNTARRLLGAVAVDDLVYAFGGNCDDPNWFTNKAEVFNTLTNEWRYISDVPASGEMSAIYVNGVIYVIVHGNFIYQYDPTLDSYLKINALPLPEWFCFDTAVIGNSIIAYGGATLGKWSSKAFRFDTVGRVWVELAEMTACRRRCGGAVVSTQAHCLARGGAGGAPAPAPAVGSLGEAVAEVSS